VLLCALLSLAISSCERSEPALPFQGFNSCYQMGIEAGREGALEKSQLCENKEAFWAGYRQSELELSQRGKRKKVVPPPTQRLDYETERRKGEQAFKDDDYDAWNLNQDNPWFKDGWHGAAQEFRRNRKPTPRELGRRAYMEGDYDALELNRGDTMFYVGWLNAADLVAAAEAKRLQEVTGANYIFERTSPNSLWSDEFASNGNAYESRSPNVRQPLSRRRINELVESALDRAEEEMKEKNFLNTPSFENAKAQIQLKHIERAAEEAGVSDDDLLSGYLLDKLLRLKQ